MFFILSHVALLLQPVLVYWVKMLFLNQIDSILSSLPVQKKKWKSNKEEKKYWDLFLQWKHPLFLVCCIIIHVIFGNAGTCQDISSTLSQQTDL